MTHARPVRPVRPATTDTSDAIRRAALKAWHTLAADPQEAWAHMHAIGMVSSEQPGTAVQQLELETE